jgi:hypothetical protein
MPVYLTYFIQILLVIHVLKTGRNRYWIYLLLFVPLVGGIAYLVIEILPEFSSSIQGQRAMRSVRNAVNPEADLAMHAAAWEQSTNADNARRYASALINHGQFSQANAVLDQALSGFFSSEPTLLLLRARIAYETGKPEEAVNALEYLQQENPEFRSAEGHLLYARSLEATERMAEAIDEYQTVSNYFPGVEARYRLARAFISSGETEKARKEFEQIVNDANLAPPHFRKSQKIWLTKAKEQIKLLLMEQP